MAAAEAQRITCASGPCPRAATGSQPVYCTNPMILRILLQNLPAPAGRAPKTENKRLPQPGDHAHLHITHMPTPTGDTVLVVSPRPTVYARVLGVLALVGPAVAGC